MNKVVIIGNLTADPEAYTTQGGVSRSTFRVAVPRPHKREETDFLTVVAWRGAADFCNQYLKKGNKVAVEGSIQTRSYDAQDGSKRYVTEIIAESVEGLTRADSGAQGNTEGASPAQKPKARDDEFKEVDDDELPF